MAIDLKDLVCVVTGAAEGVGRGLVHGFLRRGAQVVAGVRHGPTAFTSVRFRRTVSYDCFRIRTA